MNNKLEHIYKHLSIKGIKHKQPKVEEKVKKGYLSNRSAKDTAKTSKKFKKIRKTSGDK